MSADLTFTAGMVQMRSGLLPEASLEQGNRLIREAADAFGRVDVVVSNAGGSPYAAAATASPRFHARIIELNLIAPLHVAQSANAVMQDQAGGGSIIMIGSVSGVRPSPGTAAYGAAKADQAHQVRLLAAELGEFGIRVNGINPDGVVRGSGIFAKGWGAQRAAVYGVAEEDLGAFYAKRTLLKREVLPDHVAAAVFALTGGDLSLTTGLHIPVDAGVAAAFLR